MAITKTRLNSEARIILGNNPDSVHTNTDAIVQIRYIDRIDDPDDDDLPVDKVVRRNLTKYLTAEDGTQSLRDVSGEEQWIQDICAAVWT